MRRRITFLAGIAVGVVAGARIGRERYEQAKNYVQKLTENPTVRKTAKAASQKAGELTKAASQQAADKLPKAAEQAKAGAGKVRDRFSHGHDGADPDNADVNGALPRN
ncbi:MAG TPA: hypothetical protein VKU39_15925 [Streptosporangiaceae bacterium]|nr:hypothetical protein [Streptosporangiaceae bacterium]